MAKLAVIAVGGNSLIKDYKNVDLVARRPAVVDTNRAGEMGQPSRDQSRPRSIGQDAVRTQETRQPETPDLAAAGIQRVHSPFAWGDFAYASSEA